MTDMILTTYDWVPDGPRGYVRDIRIRWALEEAGLPYRIATTPVMQRNDDHIEHQPFGQVPWLVDGDLNIFESGAILLHVGEKSDILLPAEPRARNAAITWLFAALNSVEAYSLPWSLPLFTPQGRDAPGWAEWDKMLRQKLKRLEPEMAAREWLAGLFSIADIMMADVLRLTARFDGLADYPAVKAYVARATARPAFAKALADQITHFRAADAARKA